MPRNKRRAISSSNTTIPFLPQILIAFLSLSFIGFVLIIQDPPLIRTRLPGLVIESSDIYQRRSLRENEMHKINKKRIHSNDNGSEDVVGNNELLAETESNDIVHIVNTR